MRKLRSAGVLLLPLLVAASATAASFIVPADRELVHAAKAIVIATAQSSYVVPADHGMINTVYVMRVDEVIKGEINGQTIEVVEPGGFIGGVGVAVPGAPSYHAGERALIFLDATEQRDWRTWSMGIGRFNFVRDLHGQRLLMRGQGDEAIFGWDAAGNPYREVVRSEEKFLRFVREEACGGTGDAFYAVDESTVVWKPKVKSTVNGSGFHACDYAFNIGPFCSCAACGGKWKDIFDQPGGAGSVNFQLIGSQSGGVNGTNGVNAGMAAWNGNSLSNVNLGTAGSSSSTIHFDDNADTAVCGGAAVGCTQTSFSGSLFTFDTGSFAPITSNTISFKVGFTGNQTAFDQVACHELGHSLGFRHSDAGTPSTTSAVMVATAGPSFFGANLQTWDTDAVQTMYNPSPGVTCTPPSATAPTANPTTITSGSSSTLTPNQTGTGPFTYIWYQGASGDVSMNLGGGTSKTVSPTVTTQYWVRVLGQCAPTSDSPAVTVTVQPVQCPSSVVAVASPTSIPGGSSSSLSVTASGTSPTFQWFIGTPPTGTNTGQTGTPVTVTPASTTTYYAHAMNSCGSVDSNTVTVTVTCQNASINQGPFASSSSITAGNSVTLNVVASGSPPLSYQWFIGNSPNTGTPISGATQSQVTDTPPSTRTYWVRVSGACGSPQNSGDVTVTVSAACVPPGSVVASANPATIQPGGTSTLSVSATGTGLTYQWFTGSPPGTQINGANGPTLQVTPAATTTYFVKVTGQCGNPSQIDSNTVTVTVSTACVAPSVTTHPGNKTVIVGVTATLSVIAAGTAPLHYQWFEGATGDTTKPRGTDSATFTTAPLTAKTLFWVRVTGNCGQPANSNTATVDVKGGRPRPVRH